MSHRRMTSVVAAAAVLAVSGMGASYATPAVSHRPTQRIVGQGQFDEPHQSMPAQAFRAYHRPTSRYTGDSCVIDLSKYDDLTLHTKVRGCGTTVTFSTAFERMSVPDEWGDWSCPPDSESCTPDVMYSNGAVAATIDFGTTVTTGGFEYEPNTYQVETVRVEFFSGPYGSGTLVGTITRDIDGSAGARLFGARSKAGFESAVVTDNSDDDFAIAQMRV